MRREIRTSSSNAAGGLLQQERHLHREAICYLAELALKLGDMRAALWRCAEPGRFALFPLAGSLSRKAAKRLYCSLARAAYQAGNPPTQSQATGSALFSPSKGASRPAGMRMRAITPCRQNRAGTTGSNRPPACELSPCSRNRRADARAETWPMNSKVDVPRGQDGRSYEDSIARVLRRRWPRFDRGGIQVWVSLPKSAGLA